MGTLDSVLGGFQVALAPENLLWVLLGVTVGMVVGILPGLGPGATTALLLPLSYMLEPTTAILMLAGIYYGSFYGGTITTVLLRLPGEAASVVTALDGYAMARQGRAGSALGVAAIGSFVGGIVAVLVIMAAAPHVAAFALKFGPPEYSMVAILGLLMVCYVGQTSMLTSVISVCAGLMLATVGIDTSGEARFAGSITELLGGIDFVAVVMGVYGVGEVLFYLYSRASAPRRVALTGNVWPNRKDLRDSAAPIARGTVIGSLIGNLPGGGAFLSSLASYATEKRVSRHPGGFGKGAIEGVAGPETANNAGSTTAFIPMLTLGIPTNAVMAIIFGAFLVQGITPGPMLIRDEPEVFWGVVCSMVVGNAVLLVFALPLIRVFVKVLRLRMEVLAPVIVVITLIGVYSINNSIFDMYVMLAFGALGFLMRMARIDPSPLVLAFVLGPILEKAFRQSMVLSGGELNVFVTRPISLVILVLILGLLLTAIASRAATLRRRQRETIDA